MTVAAAVREGSTSRAPGIIPSFHRLWEADFDTAHTVTAPPFPSPFQTPAQLNALGSAAPGPLEGMICSGDSGGSLYVTINGQTMLAGTNEALDTPFTDTPTRGYGTIGYWTPLDDPTNIAWLQSVDTAIAFDSPIPEPGGMPTFALGLAGIYGLGRHGFHRRIAPRFRRVSTRETA